MATLLKNILTGVAFLAFATSVASADGKPREDRVGKGDIQAMVNAGFTGQDAHATHENGGFVHSALAGFSRVEINFFRHGQVYCSQDYLALHIGWGYFENDGGTAPSVPEQLDEFECLDIRWQLKKPGEMAFSPVEDNDGPAKAVVGTAIHNAWGSWHGMVMPSWHIFEAGELVAGTHDILLSLWYVCGNEDVNLFGYIPSIFVVVDDGPACD